MKCVIINHHRLCMPSVFPLIIYPNWSVVLGFRQKSIYQFFVTTLIYKFTLFPTNFISLKFLPTHDWLVRKISSINNTCTLQKTHLKYNSFLYNTILQYNTSQKYRGGRTGLMVRASDSGSGDPGSILGRFGVLFP